MSEDTMEPLPDAAPTSGAPAEDLPLPEPVKGMTDRAAAYVRTIWPVALGHVAAGLVAFVAARTGVKLSEGWAFELVALAAVTAVYGAGRWLEGRRGTGWLSRVARWGGRWLLSIGVDTGRPVYVPHAGTGR